MIGLLYKDFISTKSKYVITELVGDIAIIFFLRILSKGNVEIDVFAALFFFMATVIAYGYVLFFLELSIMKVDEGRNQKNYYLSLPISKGKYVASKYIYLLLAVCVVSLLQIIAMEIGDIAMVDANASKIYNVLMATASIIVIVAAIEIPFFIGLGTEKGNAIKISIICIMLFVFIVYMLFGDLTVFEDTSKIFGFFEEHKGKAKFIPLVALIMYGMSYFISCKLFAIKDEN